MCLDLTLASPTLTPGGPGVYPEFPLRAPRASPTAPHSPRAIGRARRPWSGGSGRRLAARPRCMRPPCATNGRASPRGRSVTGETSAAPFREGTRNEWLARRGLGWLGTALQQMEERLGLRMRAGERLDLVQLDSRGRSSPAEAAAPVAPAGWRCGRDSGPPSHPAIGHPTAPSGRGWRGSD
jgi:hypothetical protein